MENRSMRISILYSTKFDNYDGNPYIGEVGLRISGHDEDGNAITSFDDRSLVIYWLGPEDSADQVVEDPDHILGFYKPLSVSPHNGARLMVAGKRGGQTELIKSEPTGAGQTLRVVPRTLTLTAAEAKRSPIPMNMISLSRSTSWPNGTGMRWRLSGSTPHTGTTPSPLWRRTGG